MAEKQQQLQNLTLVFVDIPTIGAIREEQGEAVARDCQQRCLTLLGDVRKQFAGNLVRSIGGTLLCSFVNAPAAISAGVGMQRAVVSSGLAANGVRIRIGMHCGDVQIRNGNYSGEVVTVAARMVTLAKTGCIVAAASVREQAGGKLAPAFVPLGGDAGKRLNMELYEIRWRDEGVEIADGDAGPIKKKPSKSRRKTRPKNLRPIMIGKRVALKEIDLREIKATDGGGLADDSEKTSISPVGGRQRGTLPPESKLCLIWREKVLVVDAGTTVSMGRDDTNDIVLQVHTASRRHAEVCFRGGCFVLTDASANGTFIYDEKGEEYFAHASSAKLGETGAICPGCPQDEPGGEVLLYWMAN